VKSPFSRNWLRRIVNIVCNNCAFRSEIAQIERLALLQEIGVKKTTETLVAMKIPAGFGAADSPIANPEEHFVFDENGVLTAVGSGAAQYTGLAKAFPEVFSRAAVNGLIPAGIFPDLTNAVSSLFPLGCRLEDLFAQLRTLELNSPGNAVSFGKECTLHLPDGEMLPAELRIFSVAEKIYIRLHLSDAAATPEFLFQLLDAQMAGRRNLARCLHDTVAQDLVLLTLSLARLQRDPNIAGTPGLPRTMELIDKCDRELRMLSATLAPPVLDGQPVEATLEWFVRHLQADAGVDVELDAVAPEAEFDTAPTQTEIRERTLLFALVQHWAEYAVRRRTPVKTVIRLTEDPASQPKHRKLEFFSTKAGDEALTSMLASPLLSQCVRALNGQLGMVPGTSGSSAWIVF